MLLHSKWFFDGVPLGVTRDMSLIPCIGIIFDVTTFEPGDNFFFPRFFTLSYSRFLSFLTKGENLEVKPFHHFFDE